MAITEHIKNICKIGQGGACCKYLAMGADGFECMKINPANKRIIDQAWATTEHVAQGDNCEGRENLANDSTDAEKETFAGKN